MNHARPPRPRRSPSRRPRRAKLAAAALGVLVAAATSVLPPAVDAQEAAPRAAAAGPRGVEDIRRDLNTASNSLTEVMPEMSAVLAEPKRSAVAAKALPVLRTMTRLVAEYGEAVPQAKGDLAKAQLELWAMMALLGDAQADDEIRRRTVAGDEAAAADAKGWSVALRWVRARADAGAQEKLAGEYAALARAQPRNPTIAQVASLMGDAAATPALAEQVERVVTEVLRHPLAEDVGREMAGRRKVRALENRPLLIEGRAMDGSRFSTDGWKGKVVLVDFWATSCPPCVAEFPALKKLYADHHAKGLEVVGIACDRDGDPLKAFLAKNPDVSWPQLYEPGQTWHPLADRLGVHGLPRMFLIDRKGIVRSVTAREDYQEMVPKLLAEKE